MYRVVTNSEFVGDQNKLLARRFISRQQPSNGNAQKMGDPIGRHSSPVNSNVALDPPFKLPDPDGVQQPHS